MGLALFFIRRLYFPLQFSLVFYNFFLFIREKCKGENISEICPDGGEGP